jgi:hypothetical protein
MNREQLQEIVFKKWGPKGFLITREYMNKVKKLNPFDLNFGQIVTIYLPSSVQIGTTELFGDIYYGSGPTYEEAFNDAKKRSPQIWDGIV